MPVPLQATADRGPNSFGIIPFAPTCVACGGVSDGGAASHVAAQTTEDTPPARSNLSGMLDGLARATKALCSCLSYCDFGLDTPMYTQH